MKKIVFCLMFIMSLMLTSCETYGQTVEFTYSYNGYDVVYVSGLPYCRVFIDNRLDLRPIPRPEWGRIERRIPVSPRGYVGPSRIPQGMHHYGPYDGLRSSTRITGQRTPNMRSQGNFRPNMGGSRGMQQGQRGGRR